MSDEMTVSTESLGKWVISVVALGIIGLLTFLGKTVFKGMFDRLDAMVSKIESIAQEMASTRSDLAVMAEKIGQLQQENKDQQVRIDSLANWWRDKFDRLQEELRRK